MKRTQKTTTKEYDGDGKLVTEITETAEEEDDGFIYPQYRETAYNVPNAEEKPKKKTKSGLTFDLNICDLDFFEELIGYLKELDDSMPDVGIKDRLFQMCEKHGIKTPT